MTDQPETRMVAVDGTDALAYVILRPGSNASGVVIEAAAKGISKPYAAYALRHTAQSWDPDDTVGADVGEQLKEALAEIGQLKADRNRFRAAWNNARSRAQGHAADLAYAEEVGGQAIRAEAQAVHDLEAEVIRLRAINGRLAHAAENGKHSLAAFVSDSSDPGSAALGALYLLRAALVGQPDIEPAYLEVTPEALRAAHFREAARLLEDADCDDDAVNLLGNVARGIADTGQHA